MKRVLWILGGACIIAGAAWLMELLWRGAVGDLDLVPLAIGAVLAGLTLSRAIGGRGAVAIALASSLLLTAAQAVALAKLGTVPPWTTLNDAPSLFVFGAVTLVGAVAGAYPRLRGEPEHALLWLWVSGLVTLGCMVNGLMFTLGRETLTGAGVAIVILAPIVAGALTQALVARRMIWICGGGALMFVAIILDQSLRSGDVAGIIPSMCGAAMFVLFGALGARIAWRIQHGADHDVDRPPELPEARLR